MSLSALSILFFSCTCTLYNYLPLYLSSFPPTLLFLQQNITFEGFDEVLAEEGVEVVKDEAMEGDEDIDLMDTSSWAGSDRDYTYDEVREREV